MAEEQPKPPPSVPQRWKKATTAPAGGTLPMSGRRKKAFVLLAVMLALAGAIAAWLFLIRPFREPYFVTIPISEYRARQFPVNALAAQDSAALIRHFPHGKEQFESQERQLLIKTLEDLRHRPDEAVVLHLRAHAISQENEVYLLPSHATPDDSGTWLALSRVIQLFRECPARSKLLILDVMRPIADARLGMLTDDVSERVHQLLKGVDDPRLLVLCACSPGETSLVAEDLGQSAFGFYLDEGLRGYSDSHNPAGRRDDRISVRELAEFVRNRVERWSVNTRGLRQTPVLVGRGGDFLLATQEKGQLRPARDYAPAEAFPTWLRAGWQLRDEWWQDESYRAAPRVFRQLEATLLRAEQRWRGGVQPERIQDELSLDLKGLKEQVRRALDLPGPQPRTLAQAFPQGFKADPEMADALRVLLARFDQPAPPKPDEADKLRKELEKVRDDFLQKFKAKPAAEVAGLVFEAAVNDVTPRREKVRLLHEIVRASKPAPRFEELLVVQRLAEWPEDAGEWPAAAVPRLLRVTREAARLPTGGPVAVAWARSAIDAADAIRREATALVLMPGPRSRIEMANQRLADAERRYQAASRIIEAIDRARLRRDEALTLLPGYAGYLVSGPEIEPAERRTWEAVVQAVLAIHKVLAQTPGMGELPIEDLVKQTDDLHFQLDKLRRPFRPDAVKKAISPVGQSNPAHYWKLESLLQAPLAAAKDREAVWHRLQALSQELQERASGPIDSEAARTRPPELGRTFRRARLTLDLFELGGLKDLERLEQQLKKAERTPSDDVWKTLGTQLRVAWAEQMPRQFEKEKDLTAQDRLLRMLHPFDPDPKRSPGDTNPNPAAELRRVEARTLWRWLAQRCRAEARAVARWAGGPGSLFLDESAEEYDRFAR